MATAMDVDPGRELRITRQDARLSQQEVADHVATTLGIKVSRPLVSKWERNKSVPHITEWLVMMRLFASRGVSTQGMTIATWSLSSAAA